MNVVLVRVNKTDKWTQGKLFINGEYICETLEPPDKGWTYNGKKNFNTQEIINFKKKEAERLRYYAIPTYDNYYLSLTVKSTAMATVGGNYHVGGIRAHFANRQQELDWINRVNIGMTHKGGHGQEPKTKRLAYNPLVCGFPDNLYGGVRIHNGVDELNTAGCILPGYKMPAKAFNEADYQLFGKIYDMMWDAHVKGEKIHLKVTYDDTLAKEAKQKDAEPTPTNNC